MKQHTSDEELELETKARLAGIDWDNLDFGFTEFCPFCKASLYIGVISANLGLPFPQTDQPILVYLSGLKDKKLYIKQKSNGLNTAFERLCFHCHERHPEKYIYFLRKLIDEYPNLSSL